MKRIVIVSILILFSALNLNAGGGACAKVVIDNYFVYDGEAAAMAEAYAKDATPAGALMRQELAAMVHSGRGFCDAFMQLYERIQFVDEDVAAGIKLSYLECDWAKEMRGWRDDYNAGTVTPEQTKQRAMRLRAWNDQLAKYIQDTSAKYIAEYVPKK